MSSTQDSVRAVDFSVNAGDVELKGKIYTLDPDKAMPALLLLHGIPRAKPEPGDEGYAPMARWFAQRGWAAVFFNFRGTGESGGNFHMKGWSEDMVAVTHHLKDRTEVDRDHIAAAGFSGGAATAVYTAARESCIRAVAAVSCPASFDAITRLESSDIWIKNFRDIGLFRDKGFPESMEAWKAEFEEMAPIKWVDKISPRPLLIIHGEKDELVEPSQAKKLFSKAKEPRELIWIKDGPHKLRTIDSVKEHVFQWLGENIIKI